MSNETHPMKDGAYAFTDAVAFSGERQFRFAEGLAMIESLAIYCFVVSMILIFANPFWNHVIAGVAKAAGK